MARAVTAQTRIAFILEADRKLEKDDPDRTTFWCKPLTAREHYQSRCIAAGDGDEKEPVWDIIRRRGESLLFYGLLGWDRLRGVDAEGLLAAVPFTKDTGKDCHSQPYLDHLDLGAVSELTVFLNEGCVIKADMVGKSDGPSSSQGDDPASPAELAAP